MDAIFINSQNSKTPVLHRLLLKFPNRNNKYLLCQIVTYAIHRKTLKKSYKNKKFKILAPTWNDKFEFPERSSYFVSDI